MIDIMYQLEKMIEIDFMKDRQTGKTGRTAFLQVKTAVYDGLYDENPIEWQRKLESLCISKNETTAFGLDKVKQRLTSLLQTSNATRVTLIESLRVEEPSKQVGIEKRKKTLTENKAPVFLPKPIETLPVEDESSESSNELSHFEAVNLGSQESSSEIEKAHECSVDLVERHDEMADNTETMLDKQFPH